MQIVYEKRLAAEYYLRAHIRLDSMAIYNDAKVKDVIVCVPYTVYAVGWNDDFIIAKIHPKDQPYDPLEPRLGKTIWCISDVRNRSSSCGDNKRFHAEADYLAAREQMGVPNDLDFSLVFDELDKGAAAEKSMPSSVVDKFRSRATEAITKLKARQWLIASVRFYRSLGFYKDDAGLSDAALADKLEALYRQQWHEDIVPHGELIDLQLLSWDTHRVWWQDTEADVGQGNNIYVRTLLEWSAISRGAFVPTNLTETWKCKKGSVQVTFALNDTPHVIHTKILEDYIDVSIIEQINRLIERSRYRFEAYETFDQTAFITVLTLAEKHRLEHERAWKFMSMTDLHI